MAGRGKVQKQCDELNARERGVVEVGMLKLDSFWSRANRSFVIEGGTSSSRVKVLMSRLSFDMSRGSGPTIVLTTSEELEDHLVAWVQQTGRGVVQACTPRNRYYDYFFGWSDAEIADFIISVANDHRLASPDLVQLIHAFVCVLRCTYQPSLGAMCQLARYDMESLAASGVRQGIPSDHVNALNTATPSTVSSLRLLLSKLASALGRSASLHEETCQNLSVSRLYPHGVFVVNVSSNDPALINAYFAREVERVLNRGLGVHLALVDVPMRPGDPLASVLQDAQHRGLTAGLCYLNASRMLESRENDLGTLAFGARVLLFDGAELSPADLDTALQTYGAFHYHYPVFSAHAVPLGWLDPLRPKGQWAIAVEERLRVRPQDTVGYAGLFYGADGPNTIRLVRRY